MTDQDPALPVPALTADFDLSEAGPDTDWVLGELIELVNRAHTNIGVTLLVQGAVLSGQLISVRQYYEEYGKLWFDGTGGTDIGARIRDRWAKIANLQHENITKPDVRGVPRFVHLRDARYYSANGAVPGSGGFLWRGRLSDVSGFSMGSLGST